MYDSNLAEHSLSNHPLFILLAGCNILHATPLIHRALRADPIPVHKLGAYKELERFDGQLPVTNAAAGRLLSLPMFPELTDAQQDVVCRAVKTFYACE